MCLVHELEQLVDDRLEEPPVRAQESRVLPDDVHYVGRDDGLVVLALLLLAKAKKILENKKNIYNRSIGTGSSSFPVTVRKNMTQCQENYF